MRRLAALADLALAAACTTADTDGSGDMSTGTTGTAETSAADASTAASTTDAASTTAPPPECGDLTPCGVLCVDPATDPDNCGACGVACAVAHGQATCQAGACALAGCDPGYADCDQDPATGCEQPLQPGQECGAICKEGKPEACNLFDDNCDGACDEGAIPGCRVGVHRSNSPTLGHFYTTDLAEAQSGDLGLEIQDFYRLYVAAQPGLVPFHRCLKGNGKRFYTQAANCEGGGALEGVLGHIAPAELCGAVPLYRLYKGDTGAHFYTHSATERDSAVSMYGFQYESIAGYVWLAP